MFCNQCGKESPNDAVLCGSCGAEIGESDQDSRIKNSHQKIPGKFLTSLIIGIISVVFLFFSIYVALILGFMGVIIGFVAIMENPDYDMRLMWFAVLCNSISIAVTILMIYVF